VSYVPALFAKKIFLSISLMLNKITPVSDVHVYIRLPCKIGLQHFDLINTAYERRTKGIKPKDA